MIAGYWLSNNGRSKLSRDGDNAQCQHQQRCKQKDSDRCRHSLLFAVLLFTTSQLLDAVFGGDETLLKKLRRKAELQKVRNAYSGPNLSVCSAADADIEHYLRLAKALSDHYCSTNSLQSLSTLLKVNDKMISRAEEVNGAYAPVFSIVLSGELDAICGLYGDFKER